MIGRRAHGSDGEREMRGQSSVIGVALMLGATVVALGVLTASVGTLIDGQTGRADAERVAQDLDEIVDPVETTGHSSGTIRFAEGGLKTVERELRVLDGSGVVAVVDIGGLVYDRGEHRVASVGGAVIRSQGDSAWTVDPPPIVGSESTETLVVGAAKLNGSGQSAGGGTAVRLATNVSHDRRSLGTGEYSVAIETRTPGAFERVFEERNASVTRRDFDGDGVPSVVASFPGERRGYLAVHDVRLEVGHG